MDESSLENISNEAPTLSICRVFRLTSVESLDEVSCLMMSDTGLYLNWIPSTVIAHEDEEDEEIESTVEDDVLIGKWIYIFFKELLFSFLLLRITEIIMFTRVCK